MSSDKTATHSWDWILSAEESQVYISLLIRKRPFYELYLSKSKLNEVEYQTLRDWLIRHDKLV
ncbi:MAG: hypothetical protein GY714_18530 [Desulfobacterales bacterium]|nr:hypothetical protein [Desulfobacterales bacterium]MCP4164171.1 hypothetical protein [Deltaproteobacteria bacterium]